MHRTALVAASLLLVGSACENDQADQSAAAGAEEAKERAQAGKDDADRAVVLGKRRAAGSKLEIAKQEAMLAGHDLEDANDEARASARMLEREEREPERGAWLRSWKHLAERRQKVIDVGDWTVERADGAFRAWRKVKRVTVTVDDEVTDAVLLNNVNTSLAIAGVMSRDIEVSVKHGVVQLGGPVASSEQAGDAIRVALGTEGVHKVVSRTSWPHQ
jgi:hypothetical protein